VDQGLVPAPDTGGPSFEEFGRRVLAGLDAATKDPAFVGREVDATDANTKARAKLVYKDVPIVTIQNTWTIEQARAAMYAHIQGQFYASGMLCESILGDDRVTATLNARATALFSSELRFKPANDSAAAREVCDAWREWHPRIDEGSAKRELQDYGIVMGFSHAQVCWDTTQPGLAYAPKIHPWSPVFEYWDWDKRCFMAIGSDATIPIVPGNGKWLAFAPWSTQRGWMRGAIRPVVEPWLLRHFGFRDMARFGEVHGSPTRKGYVPIVGDPTERQICEKSLAGIGANAAMIVPRGVDGSGKDGYDYELVEAQSTAWEVHPAQIDRCDMAIVLAILMVNLTTEVSGGSFAAAKVHEVKERSGTKFDSSTWRLCEYTQLARPFAYLNFGDANLAPWTWYDVTGQEDYNDRATRFYSFGQAVEVLRRGGVKFKDPAELQQWGDEHFGIKGLPAFEFAEPVKSTPEKAGEAGTPPKPATPGQNGGGGK
jgi:phage gp29-like protein